MTLRATEMRRASLCVLAGSLWLAFSIIGLSNAGAQSPFDNRGGYGRGRSRGYGRGYGFGRGVVGPITFAERDIFPGEKFTFCTAWFNNVRGGPSGFGWSTDYPGAGYNFMIRLAELTTIQINRDPDGEPHQEIVKLTDDALFNYPFIFMSDVGKAGFTSEEDERLRSYLLRGGFLFADDFWGDADWDHFSAELERALPPDEFPIVDIPLSHEIFHIVFNLAEVPQVPSIHFWRGPGSDTSELGLESAEPHCRGIFNKDGRLMVVLTHNTDIADGWEREGANEDYFNEFSVKKSYPLGINIVVYAMTH